MLLAADMTKNLDWSSRIRVQTVSSSLDAAGGRWGPVKTTDHQCPWWCMRLDSYNDPAVVLGGVVHWLMHIGDSFLKTDAAGEYILTYDVNTATVGSIDLPNLEGSSSSGSKLASSPDGKLSFIAVDQLLVSIWVLSTGGSWARHAVVDMEMEATLVLGPWEEERGIKLASFGDQRSGFVLFRLLGVDQTLYGIDMETKSKTFQTLDVDEDTALVPYEVDLASRLSSMKAFSLASFRSNFNQ